MKLTLLLMLYPFILLAQPTLTDSAVVIKTNGQTIRYSNSRQSSTYIDGDSIGFRGTVSKRIGLVSPLSFPVSSATTTALNGKQPTLVSGTNIKTINGNNILGSGDIGISGTAAFNSITGVYTDNSSLVTGFATKQNSITLGITSQYFRGDLSLATFPTTTAPFSNSTDKNFVTDAQLTVINNISGENILAYQYGGSPILAETLNFPLFVCNTSTALVDNTVRFVSVWLSKAATLTGIRVYVRVQGSYTGDQNNRIGLYSYSGGTLTLVASSANSGTLWTSAANAFQTIAFSSTYAAAAGLYFVGLLYNNSAQTTAPALAGGTALNNVAMATMLGTNSIKFLGTLGVQNNLPTPQVSSGITGVTASYWVALY